MKSSGAVFTRQNPFPPSSPVGKTYYHPSRTQGLSKKKRKTTLSPVRPNQRASPPLQICSLSPQDQHLLGKPDHLFTCLHPHTDGQPSFSESWPSTDRGSSPANTTASSDMERPKQSEPAGKTIVSSDQRDQQDSVLAKYIERFRHGRPQSREERQQLPFWWMSPSPLLSSSTPTEVTDTDVILPLKDDHEPAILSPVGQHRRGSTPSPCRGSFSVSAFVLSDTSQGDLDDTEILQLQERASRLLQKSDGSIPISSEGLGCSDFSSPVSIDEPVRRPLVSSLMESSTAPVNASSASHHAGPSQKTSVTPSLVPHTCPGDDILFQWRLRRKMEQAREWPQSQQYSSLHRSTFSWQNPSLYQPPVPGLAHKLQQNIQPPETSQRVTPTFISAPQPKAKEAHGLHPGPSASPPFPVSSSSVSKLQSDTDAHVPRHMHLLCDVLPCPTQSSPPSSQQRSSRRLDGFRTKVVPKNPQQVLEYSTDSCTEEPISKHMSSPPPDSSGTTEEEWPFHHRRAEWKNKQKEQTKESEKNEKRTAMSSRKQKKSTSRGPKKVKSWPEQPSSRNGGQLERCQGLSSESCTGNRAPPPSPIHSALGQVVSEVLFPTLDSSPAQRTPVLSDSPPYTPSAPPQSPVPSGNAENTMEVISQLLREAEDSDEKEFEDDPLLQVLRKQRKWVKEQISEVDSMLDEFQEE